LEVEKPRREEKVSVWCEAISRSKKGVVEKKDGFQKAAETPGGNKNDRPS